MEIPRNDLKEVDPYFGHWLAGFVDGEGCFQIQKIKTYYATLFTLALRDDDSDIIYEIYHRLGNIGHIYPIQAEGKNSQIGWRVDTKAECLALVDVFDAFSLRAKKANDYIIWRKAVFAWASCAETEVMGRLQRELREGREYKESRT